MNNECETLSFKVPPNNLRDLDYSMKKCPLELAESMLAEVSAGRGRLARAEPSTSSRPKLNRSRRPMIPCN